MKRKNNIFYVGDVALKYDYVGIFWTYRNRYTFGVFYIPHENCREKLAIYDCINNEKTLTECKNRLKKIGYTFVKKRQFVGEVAYYYVIRNTKKSIKKYANDIDATNE